MGLQTKTLILAALTLTMLSSVKSYAGVEDFQGLINDSLAAKQELSHKLRQNIDQTQSASNSEKKMARNESNEANQEREVNVAVRSKGILFAPTRSRLATTAEKNKMNRLSEEIENTH
jgi:hypothetical protein